MSRYRGPRVRTQRALGTALPGLSTKSPERRPYPPGQHGQNRRKVSEYARRLQEKQKLCKNYGVTERQMRRLMEAAKRAPGPTGDKLLELLERRLDNTVFRCGFARTIPAARQLVCHGHVTVDGRRVDIPSFSVRPGQTVALKAKSRELSAVQGALEKPVLEPAPWLQVSAQERAGQVVALPGPEASLFSINLQLVVEYYSQSL